MSKNQPSAFHPVASASLVFDIFKLQLIEDQNDGQAKNVSLKMEMI